MQVASEQRHGKIEREEPLEVRDYQSYVVAETFVDGSFNSVGTEGFNDCSAASLANALRPTDDRVVLAEAPSRRMAIVRYRGKWCEARDGKQPAVLRKFIGERGLMGVGEPVFARYDPPFMPWFLRPNEIQTPMQDPAAH